MASILWMLFFVFCPLVLSESGDDDGSEKEVTCSSSLTLSNSNLTCSLNDEPIEEVKFATLCKIKNENGKEIKKDCKNATLGSQHFTFENLLVLTEYKLQVHIGDDVVEKEKINLSKIVKISAPEIKLVTYTEDTKEVFIWFEHSHEYVHNPKFEVEIWGDGLAKHISFSIPYKNISISRERLDEDGVYYIHIRAKPTDYFDGTWSEWSPNASFTIKTKRQSESLDSPNVNIIITIIIAFLVLLIGGGVLRWRTQIRAYVTPNIPHPKATLAQMHRAKEGLPFTFSPEIFSDVFIHSVDYIDEKPSSLELQGDDDSRYSRSSCSSTSVSEMDMKADDELPREQSHLKIRLLEESDLPKERENGGCQALTALQRECKDEAYVTMSSLFKTQ